jgi:hypothetical protein
MMQMDEKRWNLRRTLLAGLLAACLIGSVAIGVLWPLRFFRDWRDVKPGMTLKEVRAILGGPEVMGVDADGAPLSPAMYTLEDRNILYVHFKNGAVSSVQIAAGP